MTTDLGICQFINLSVFCSFGSQLASNKNVQVKLRNEIEKHSDSEGRLSFEALNDVAYLEQVFNETLRMHSPAAFLSRKCTESVELSFEGQKVQIEKDLNVFVPIHQIHCDPEHYAEPEKFMPERFDPENGGVKAFRDKGVFLPFGDGPRVCLGMRFAQLQSMAGVAAIIKNFDLSVNSKTATKLEMDPKEFLNVKKGGLWLDFKPV